MYNTHLSRTTHNHLTAFCRTLTHIEHIEQTHRARAAWRSLLTKQSTQLAVILISFRRNTKCILIKADTVLVTFFLFGLFFFFCDIFRDKKLDAYFWHCCFTHFRSSGLSIQLIVLICGLF